MYSVTLPVDVMFLVHQTVNKQIVKMEKKKT